MSTEHRGIVGELKADSARRTLGDLGGHTPDERPDGWGMDGLSWAEAAAPAACVGGRPMRRWRAASCQSDAYLDQFGREHSRRDDVDEDRHRIGGNLPRLSDHMGGSMNDSPVPRWGTLVKSSSLVCGLAVAASLALAAPARADQYEYVSVLDNEGVYYSSITDVIDQGKMACRLLRGGAGVPAALNSVTGGGYAPYESAIIVAAAARNMCPDVMPAIEAFINGQDRGALA